MNFEKCDICDDFHYVDGKCKPLFYFKHEDYGNEFQEIRADYHEEAAEKFAELFNEDGDLTHSSTEVIISDGKIEKKYNVSAEPSIAYFAREIE